ncbi:MULTISPECIES: hypothetical protein [Sphingobacterium]|uniref:hypothetical protein n=1 Tax=Sphingobacterium TaxID=28453 RepID=UPI000EC41EFC|nr:MULTISPECIES: hypothetical protein [Sphingobacterium]HAK28421.1 hypothetical protein [Sphingobacterium sp.]
MRGKIQLDITLQDRFDSMYENILSPRRRYTSYIISSFLQEEKFMLYERFKAKLGNLVVAPKPDSPKALFEFLQRHNKDLIIFEDEILNGRIEYIDVLSGAICSSPDSNKPRKVQYFLDNFIFKGSIIISSIRTKEELLRESKLKDILRDCIII